MIKIMLSPIANGVLTRTDDPKTSKDERLHDTRARDVGVRGNILDYPITGNILDYPITSMFEGDVITAADRKDGYGKAVRIEGTIRVYRSKVDVIAREPWPWDQLPHQNNDLYVLHARALYGHANSLWVKPGDYVQLYQPIMGMGNTGKSQGIHVHVKLRLLDLPEPICFVDPLPLFRYTEV